MPRQRKKPFTQPKMLSSRVEMSDYNKLELKLLKENLSVQDFLNLVVVNYVSGAFSISGSKLLHFSGSVSYGG
jgi:hypothetical protein